MRRPQKLKFCTSKFPNALQGASQTADTYPWSLKERSKEGPQSDARAMLCAQNIVKSCSFEWFHKFRVFLAISYYQDQRLNTYGSKKAFWVVSGRFGASHKLAKVVIWSNTSLKNLRFKYCVSKTASKALLGPLHTTMSLENEVQEGSQNESWSLNWPLLELLDAQSHRDGSRPDFPFTLTEPAFKSNSLSCRGWCKWWN